MIFKCVFCRAEIVGENWVPVFPQWLLDELHLDGDLTLDWMPPASSRPRDRQRSRADELRAHGVCSACRDGWLSDLELRSKDLWARALFDGADALRLEVSEAPILASWAFATASLLNWSVNYRRLVTLGQLHAFHKDGKPPTGFHIDFVFHANTYGVAEVQSRAMLARLPAEAPADNHMKSMAKSFTITMQIGPLTFRVAYLPDDLFVLQQFAPTATLLWPSQGRKPSALNRADEIPDFKRHHFELSLTDTISPQAS